MPTGGGPLLSARFACTCMSMIGAGTFCAMKGLFSFANVELNQRMLVELVNLKQNKIVCTEGPFVLSAPALTNKTDVNIDCGKPPAALWLLAAGAGAAAAIAIGTRSASQ
jgi:hypothetical protein